MRDDLTGQRFGRLVAIRPIEGLKLRGRCGVAWECRCDCGDYTIVMSYELKKGIRRSCGCKRRNTGRHDRLDQYGCALCADFGECGGVCRYANELDSYGTYQKYEEACKVETKKAKR